MANIKITVNGALMDGHRVTFKAPCDCVTVENLKICYVENGTQKSRLFTMKDSHCNDLTGLGNLFSEGAYVDAILDTNNDVAYLQNAATNKYLEQKNAPVDNLESDSTDLSLSARQGKILNSKLDALATYSTEPHIVGKWIDGKDLYEATLVFDSPAVEKTGTAVTDTHDISHLGTMTMAFVESAFYLREGSTGTRVTYYQLPSRNANGNGISITNVRIDNQTIGVSCDDQNYKYGGSVYITLRYTKAEEETTV